MSNYDGQTERIHRIAKAAGYTAINIDHNGLARKQGNRLMTWTITAKAVDVNVRVLIGHGSSWINCYTDARDYLD